MAKRSVEDLHPTLNPYSRAGGSNGTNGINGANGIRDPKRVRMDSAVSQDNTANAPRRSLTGEERNELRDWLERQSAKDSVVFGVAYLRPTAKSAKAKTLPSKWSVQRLVLHGHEYGQIAYTVGHRARWEDLDKYKRCTLSEQTFSVGECVLIRSEDQSDSSNAHEDDDQDEDQDDDDEDDDSSIGQWKAQIHEIRALDENNVYLLVSWLYRPSKDVPDGKRSYHGHYELIPSTELSIIDAKTIDGRLSIKYWDEYKEDEVFDPTQYFWRQSYDHLAQSLSPCRSMCRCSQPQNPDEKIVQCPHCLQWQHARCLELEAIEKYQSEHRPTNAKTTKNGTPNGETSKPIKSKGGTLLDGVQANLSGAEEDDSGKLSVIVKDTKDAADKGEEHDVACLLCAKSIDK